MSVQQQHGLDKLIAGLVSSVAGELCGASRAVSCEDDKAAHRAERPRQVGVMVVLAGVQLKREQWAGQGGGHGTRRPKGRRA